VIARNLVLACALLTGCHSNNDPTAQSQDSAHPKAQAAEETTPVGVAPFANGNGEAQDIDPAELDKANALDADEAIERYGRDCKPGDSSQPCRALRGRAEYTFLEELLWLKSTGQTPDPQLYRVAAVAENPRLATLGLRGLLLVTTPLTQPDEQLVVAALDSPYRGVRQTILQFANNQKGVRELWPRIVTNSDSYTDFPYLDDRRDSEPDHAVIGSYPGARFRYFASAATQPWFTTTDPLDKVIAFLAKGESQALTAAELNAKNQSDAMQKYMQATRAASETGDSSKVMEAMKDFQMQSGVDWTRQLSSVEGAGEIRYIELAPEKMIAVFDDAVLHATSIVAIAPPTVPEEMGYALSSPEDLEGQLQQAQQQARQQAEEQELLRQILGH